MAYATGNLPTNTRGTLDHFWDRLTGGPVEPEADEAVEFVE
jgi:hypothetical protein